MLAYFVAAVGVFVAVIGAGAIVAPATFRELVRASQGPRTLYAAIGVRLLVGAFFVLASEACSWPLAIGTVGVMMLAAGFVGLFIGIDRVMLLIAWFLAGSDAVLRGACVLAVFFGSFVVYAAL